MKFKDIEKQIKNEIEANSPAYESVIERCRCANANSDKSLVPVTVGAPYSNRGRKSMLGTALIVALLAVIAIITTMCLLPKQDEMVGGYFIIDINPSFEISYDKDGRVVTVTALNEDAEVLLFQLELDGKSYTEVVQIIVENSIELGYISPNRQDNAILTTAVSENGVKDEKMTEKIKEAFFVALSEKSIVGEVLTGIYDKELEIEAEKYGIDGQKLSLIKKYLGLGGELDESDYEKITIRELYYSILQKEKDAKNQKIAELESKKAKAEDELNSKAKEGLKFLQGIVPKGTELRARIDEIIENVEKNGSSSYIDSLIELFGGIEDSPFASSLISSLKRDLEGKKEEYKEAKGELEELSKTVEEKKNQRLNDFKNK